MKRTVVVPDAEQISSFRQEQSMSPAHSDSKLLSKSFASLVTTNFGEEETPKDIVLSPKQVVNELIERGVPVSNAVQVVIQEYDTSHPPKSKIDSLLKGKEEVQPV